MKSELESRRVFGSEVEYSYTPRRKATYNLWKLEKKPNGLSHIGQYLENGGRFYMDSALLEYATPECRSLDEVVTHELAGEELIKQYYGSVPEMHTLHKRSKQIDPEMKLTHSPGAHENYSTSISIWDGPKKFDHIESLASHFATRTIFIGAGHKTETHYMLAQKMQEVTSLYGANCSTNKSLVNTRDEPLSGTHKPGRSLSRLHVITGDANISPYVIRMKFGTTSLILRLLENNEDLSDLHLSHPVHAARQVAEGVAGISTPLEMKSGKKISSLDIQEMFAEKSYDLSQKIVLPPDEQILIPQWFDIIDALRTYRRTHNPQPIMNRLDWFTKLSREPHDKNETESIHPTLADEGYAPDLWYDVLQNGPGDFLRKSEKYFASDMPSVSEVQHAVNHPPIGGRAQLRGNLISFIQKGKPELLTSFPKINKLDWEKMNIVKDSISGILHWFGPANAEYTNTEIEEKIIYLTSLKQFKN